jgi:hypothetical protein
MAATTDDRVGVLVLRVWIETSTEGAGLRGRVSATKDIVEGPHRRETTGVAGVDDICNIVRRWATAFLDGSDEISWR